jgi:UDP-N-acetylmuramoyl-L-alanyl-D-glutamate--2,6-diaminopimelate ligase
MAPNREPGMSLSDLAERLGARVAPAHGEIFVQGVQQDSRQIEPGDLFAALRGSQSDGIAHAPAAVARGARAVLVQRGRGAEVSGLGVGVLEADAPRRAMAEAAALLYGRPSEHLAVIGITGTNGKTTTAHLVQAAIDGGGGRAGVIGTLGYRFGDYDRPASHTSPEADALQRLLAEMRQRGASHVVMEVSSIALAAERVAGTRFAVAAFTNLTQDHLDYHGSMDAYASAKARLFLELDPARCVINRDDPFGLELLSRLTGRPGVIAYSAKSTRASVHAEKIVERPEGLVVTARTPRGRSIIESPLVGRHNVENLLCALAVAEALELDGVAAAAALGRLSAVPGRLERCDDPARDDIVAVVDYAHTPDALSRVLTSVRPLCRGTLWCVFGCGGDRDPQKRGPMGEAVARGADASVVTNDNPRSEDPKKIADAVVAGMERAGGRFEVELDRARAIQSVVARAVAGDVVLVAGKGHEPYQIIGDRVSSFDDREVLRTALAARRSDDG